MNVRLCFILYNIILQLGKLRYYAKNGIYVGNSSIELNWNITLITLKF